jgi:hypothetical protein
MGVSTTRARVCVVCGGFVECVGKGTSLASKLTQFHFTECQQKTSHTHFFFLFDTGAHYLKMRNFFLLCVSPRWRCDCIHWTSAADLR